MNKDELDLTTLRPHGRHFVGALMAGSAGEALGDYAIVVATGWDTVKNLPIFTNLDSEDADAASGLMMVNTFAVGSGSRCVLTPIMVVTDLNLIAADEGDQLYAGGGANKGSYSLTKDGLSPRAVGVVLKDSLIGSALFCPSMFVGADAFKQLRPELELVVSVADLDAAALSQTIPFAKSLPPGAVVIGAYIDSTVNFSGGGASLATADFGDDANDDGWYEDEDVFTGSGTGFRTIPGTPGVWKAAGIVDVGDLARTPEVTITSDVNVDTLVAGSLTARVLYAV